MRFRHLLITAALLANGAQANDLGVKGRQFDIAEPDFRVRMAREMAKANTQPIHDQLAKSADSWADELPDYGLLQSQETTTKWIDPSIVLDQDVYAPVQRPDGEWETRLLHPKGTRANPLDYVQVRDRFLVIRADSDWQVSLAVQAQAHFGAAIKIVLAQGNPLTLSKKLNTPVFYLNPLMVSRFELEFTPSLVGVGQGAHEKNLAVTRFENHATVADIERAWYGIE